MTNLSQTKLNLNITTIKPESPEFNIIKYYYAKNTFIIRLLYPPIFYSPWGPKRHRIFKLLPPNRQVPGPPKSLPELLLYCPTKGDSSQSILRWSLACLVSCTDWGLLKKDPPPPSGTRLLDITVYQFICPQSTKVLYIWAAVSARASNVSPTLL